MQHRLLYPPFLALCVFALVSCGGVTGALSPAPVSVSTTPAAANLTVGGSQTFIATVTGTANTAVSWSVREGAAGGSVSGNGVYTAPAAEGAYHVVATSRADPTKSATATVNVTDYTNTFSPTLNTLVTPRTNSTADVLGDGTVLVAGGFGKCCQPNLVLASTERFDPADSRFRAGPSLSTPRNLHSATLLGNGQLLIVGGNTDTAFLSSAELFDPTAGAFRSTGSMAQARREHTATLLASGAVLVAGGFVITNNENVTLSSAEVYEPGSGAFRVAANSMSAKRQNHTATLLGNGKVLVTGGFVPCSATVCGAAPNALASAEIYDPATGAFSATGSMSVARHHHTATRLPNGKVLIAGGTTVQNGNYVPVARTEIYDPASGTFTLGGSMSLPRTSHTATLLGNGKVLIAGGFVGLPPAPASVTATAELFNPSTATSSPAGSMGTLRAGHTATLLPSGQVLILGGVNGTSIVETAEVFK